MIPKEQITGIILSGGKSSRMGTDKALVSLDGKPFMEYVIDAVRPLVNEIVIVSDDPNHGEFGYTRVTDVIRSAGPMAGLCSGLAYSNTEFNLVLSCDIPNIDTQTLKRLVEDIPATTEIVQLADGNREHPLIALYRRSCLDKAMDLLNSGERRMRKLAEKVEVRTIDVDADQRFRLMNINSKADLRSVSHDDNS